VKNAMNWQNCEPTLAEILSDPATRALMYADGVERREIEAQLKEIGRALTRRSRPVGLAGRVAPEKR
jgi:hypothetical protein